MGKPMTSLFVMCKCFNGIKNNFIVIVIVKDKYYNKRHKNSYQIFLIFYKNNRSMSNYNIYNKNAAYLRSPKFDRIIMSVSRTISVNLLQLH